MNLNTEEKFIKIKHYIKYSLSNSIYGISQIFKDGDNWTSECYLITSIYYSNIEKNVSMADNGYLILDFKENKILIQNWNRYEIQEIATINDDKFDTLVNNIYNLILNSLFTNNICAKFNNQINNRLAKIKHQMIQDLVQEEWGKLGNDV